jgi:NADH-quinone oxidoreductase subunit L
MGGLKRDLPITYWTFLIGALAIAGVPLLSGFFSKDELLFEAFREGHTVLWLIGVVASLMTAAYMFRLVFLTFHGERRHDAPAPAHQLEDESAAQARNDSHGAGAPLHDAPPAMAFTLIVLALGSVLAGYVGVPHALGGHNQLAAWLAPSFAAPGAIAEGLHVVAEGEVALEFTLMGVSTAIAFGGIGIAVLIWIRRPQIAASIAMRYPGLHRLLLHKYFVDEAYDAAVVQPIRVGSEQVLWRGFDVRVIDAAVNGAGAVVAGSAGLLRLLQTGSVRTYAGSMLIGVVVILGYYLWR